MNLPLSLVDGDAWFRPVTGAVAVTGQLDVSLGDFRPGGASSSGSGGRPYARVASTLSATLPCHAGKG